MRVVPSAERLDGHSGRVQTGASRPELGSSGPAPQAHARDHGQGRSDPSEQARARTHLRQVNAGPTVCVISFWC